jgi:D-alanyl-D-alanine carboxypeptidase/D-alanyl-D-alanine-endopeptidase (penicillin-binding protein 4)
MKFFTATVFLLWPFFCFPQGIPERLSKAMAALQSDEQLKHASLSLYVVDSKSGVVIFEKETQLGLAAASTQKVITSVSAFELLGKDFIYKTLIGYDGKIESGVLNGNLYITGSGDPSLGSWRWKQTGAVEVRKRILNALQLKNITKVNGDIIVDAGKWETQATPRGWIWEDIGNYYGAGVWGINWHENQYDLILKPGQKVGDPVAILKTDPPLEISGLINELKTGAAGSGDQSVIYLPENGLIGFIRGTIPTGTETFHVKGSIPDAPAYFSTILLDCLKDNKIEVTGKCSTNLYFLANHQGLDYQPKFIATIPSPSFDSLNYWFLKKSVNLFGEAFVKTIAFEKKGFGSTDSGLGIIRHFWSNRGIEKSALKIIDGSGLSPANRITTYALVTVMQYAQQQKWFASFYNALPELNGIKMKDGYINGVRSYTGYIKSKSGREYTFAFIVNNFDGNASTVREKMWEVLDILK